MTLLDFKNAHLFPVGAPILGASYMKFNLLYNTYGPVTRLDAVSIRIDDNLLQLQQATALTFKAPDSGEYITVRLDDINLPIDIENIGDYFIFAIAPNASDVALRPEIPTPNPNPSSGIETYNTELIIEPVVTGESFSISDYNATYNSSTVDRTSDFIVESDRAESKTLPTNLNSILTNKARPAAVQDSNYTSTGWSNARYNGTKTSTDTFGGIEPGIIGISFEGSQYSYEITDLAIYAIPVANRTIKTYFFTPGVRLEGVIPVPDEVPSTGFLYRITGGISGTQTTFTVQKAISEVYFTNTTVGNYLYITDGSVQEIVKIVSVIHNGTNDTVYVNRNAFGTNRAKASMDVEVQANELSDISRVYELNGNKIQFVQEGKIWIKATSDILNTDPQGYSATGSKAPDDVVVI